MSAPARPTALVPAAVLVALQGLAALGYGVFEGLQARPGRLVVGLGAGLVLVTYGLGLLVLSRGLLRVRRWSRAPVVAAELIQLPIAWNFRSGNTGWFAVALGLSSAVVLVCLFLPASTAALAREVSSPDDPGPQPPTGRPRGR